MRYASLDEARADLDAPSGATYQVWDYGDQDLGQVLPTLPTDTILVLPERYNTDGSVKPYLYPTADGFTASGVSGVDAANVDGTKTGYRYPVVSKSNHWFEMVRHTGLGIIGLGPDAVIAPADSTWSQGTWPNLGANPTSRFQNWYKTDGTVGGTLSGAQCKIMSCKTPGAFFANFVMRGKDFGGVPYGGLGLDGESHKTVKRVWFDRCWRSTGGVPNIETGGLIFNKGTYLVENCDLTVDGGGSPIMWNFNPGGTIRNVRSADRPAHGMWTHWRSPGVHVVEDCIIRGGPVVWNLEETLAGFELHWSGGSASMDDGGFHTNANPAGGSQKIIVTDVEISTNGYTAGTFCAHVYTTAGVQKRSDITCDALPISYLPGSNFIA